MRGKHAHLAFVAPVGASDWTIVIRVTEVARVIIYENNKPSLAPLLLFIKFAEVPGA